MTKPHPLDRYDSFKSISAEISEGVLGEINFSQHEKNIYLKFAESLSALILRYLDKYEPIPHHHEHHQKFFVFELRSIKNLITTRVF